MENLGLIKDNFYSIEESIKLVKKLSKTKFAASIDIAIKLNLDTTKSDQQLRGTLSLPNFFGKSKKMLIIDNGLTQNDAKKLGVDFAGDKEIIDKIAGGWVDFDLIITTPKMMPLLSKLGKILGTKGLMPNPKNGNVTTDLNKTIKEFKSGISQYRTDTYGNIHMVIGKTNADDKKIIDNINFLLDFIKNKKPASVKNQFIENVSISSTMGPGVKILLNKSQDNKGSKKTKSKHLKFKVNKKVFSPITKIVYVKKQPNQNLENNKVNKVANEINLTHKNIAPIKKTPVVTKKPIASNFKIESNKKEIINTSKKVSNKPSISKTSKKETSSKKNVDIKKPIIKDSKLKENKSTLKTKSLKK